MKNLLLSLTIALLISNSFAQSYQWAKSIGSTTTDHGNSIATDASGNAYITGYFQDTADFDPGAGVQNLTSVGARDIFFAKYDTNGNYLWAKSIGSTSPDYGYSIATDASGNAYITGSFEDTADFDPGAGVQNLISVGQVDIFFAKYDANGNYLWAKSIGSTWDRGNSIATDASGNAYITGYFQGTADFDPGAAVQNLTSVGGANIFFAKYDANGNYLWAKSIGSSSIQNDAGNSIATDASGNAYITGYFYGTADFDPGAAVQNLTPVGSADVFFAKYDANGNYLWAKNIGSTNWDDGNSIATDASGNAYITGYFQATADFDPGAGVQNLTSVGGGDIFFAKYDANGNYLWAKSIGSTVWDAGNSIATDASGNAYITGYFQGTADFDPGAGVQNLTSVGNTDIFFAKYQGSGSTGIDELKAQSSKLKVYPNPYTGKTNISYTLPEKTNVSLEIYNITGKKIHTLVNKNQNAGRHQYGFSAKDLGYGKGIYLLKFRVNEINITQLLLELR
ncbi:MAG: T9SS type A sorting domain-containing protein [Solirubrobacterales bacterium]|nr:T9SS type A sorting domain-containing protein [Solirubrobacterales bacterium]